MAHKICSWCGEDKPIEEYHHKRWNAQGESVKHSHCKSCDRVYKAERRRQRRQNDPVTHMINKAVYNYQATSAAAQGSRIPGSNLLDALATYLDSRADLPRSYGYDAHERRAFRSAAQRLRLSATSLEHDQRVNPDVEAKVCPGCSSEKPLQEFRVLTSNTRGIVTKTSKYCLSCIEIQKERKYVNKANSSEIKSLIKGRMVNDADKDDTGIRTPEEEL